MTTRIITLAVYTLFLSSFAYALTPQPFRIVIDPGHGGSDQGTIYADPTLRISEKEITLLLAQETAAQLRRRGMDVILTRTTDLDVPLSVRTALANRLKADVFLSIHMNAASSPERVEASGIETYILNNATDASSRRLAQLENTVLSKSPTDTPEQTDVALILKDLRLDANLAESKRLACTLQHTLVSNTAPKLGTTKNRGVKQALFHVLLGADMPSALLEAGFLSNPQDRALVLSPAGRTLIAGSIARSLEHYWQQKNSPKITSELSRCKVH